MYVPRNYSLIAAFQAMLTHASANTCSFAERHLGVNEFEFYAQGMK